MAAVWQLDHILLEDCYLHLLSRQFPPEHATSQDACTQTAAALEPGFGSRSERGVHPVTGTAFFGPHKAHALEFEFGADECVQIHPADKYIPAGGTGLGGREAKRLLQGGEDFQRKESNLAFVIGLVIEEPIATNPAPGDTFDLVHRHHGVAARRLAVMAEEVVTWRNEQLLSLDHIVLRFAYYG